MVPNIRRRIEDLETNAPRPPEPPSPDYLNMRAILDELGALKRSRAGGWRGGVYQEPANIPGKILGPGYTQRELCELAVRRALEARGEPVGNLEAPRYVEALEVLCGTRRDDWDEPVEWERVQGGRA